MEVVAVINYKGGVGKTSLTANIGVEVARRGKSVLLIDLDAQASLTFSLISPEDWHDKFEKDCTIKEWFDRYDTKSPVTLQSLVTTPQRVKLRIAGKGSLDLVCSHLGLINVDLELATQLKGANMQQMKKSFIDVHRRLSDAIEVFEDKYDLVLIDCPPNFNIVTKTAIVACDHILVPAKPDYLSTLGIDYLIRSYRQLVSEYNEYAVLSQGESTCAIDPNILGVVFTMVQEMNGGPIAAQRQFMSRVQDIPVFESYIKNNNTIFADAPETGLPVVLGSHPSGTYRSVVDSLKAVAKEFCSKLGL